MELSVETNRRILEQPTLSDCHPQLLGPILTIIVPVYNEAQTIDELLTRVIASPYSKQIIVVNDGSTDGTGDVLEKWSNISQVEVIEHPVNRGKGSAIRTGLAQARGQFTIIQDADLEYDPTAYPLLIEPLISGKAQVVYGSRYLVKKPVKLKTTIRWLRLGVTVLNWAVRLLYAPS